MKRNILAVVLLATLTVACGSSSPTNPTVPPTVIDISGEWGGSSDFAGQSSTSPPAFFVEMTFVDVGTVVSGDAKQCLVNPTGACGSYNGIPGELEGYGVSGTIAGTTVTLGYVDEISNCPTTVSLVLDSTHMRLTGTWTAPPTPGCSPGVSTSGPITLTKGTTEIITGVWR